ncbi:iron complex transport system substrate-binding protein [Paenibacillus catalpae]|uniref:Iron complex transport system substrate-binding protein n=1 Tax=Paenibacillus catalpae TaxID=1045775 RepID=A0A1I1UR40_9BACL|nr:ABC transporter substrate-binding protein [Paenibacillus catalpae]SFD70450.1 iron complex transport system substrate-binding protein [Paenibacillus catalpae]
MAGRNKRFTKFILAVMLTAMLVFMAACGNKANTNENANTGNANASASPVQSEQPSESPAAATESVYPVKVTDATGTELVFEKAPTKVVSLAPSETEVLYAIGAANEVAGVDSFSNYPEEAASKPKVGDMTTNIEAVAALNPDLVVASSTMNTDAVEQLRKLNIKVLATDPLTYDETIAKIETIGKIMNKNSEAAQVAAHMREVKQQVSDAVKDAPKKLVYLEFSPGWTVGSGTFLDELLTIAGGTNVGAAQAGWYEVSAEEVVKQNPAIILYPDLGEDPNPIVTGLTSRPGWDAIDAVKNKQMFEVGNDETARVGPRLADALLQIAKILHPDLVK